MKQKTGQKGRALFHPIRIALTGAGDGPSSTAVPARDVAPSWMPRRVLRQSSARERAQQFARALDQ